MLPFPIGGLPNGYSPAAYPSPFPSSSAGNSPASYSPPSSNLLSTTSLTDHLFWSFKNARYTDLTLHCNYASGQRQTLALHAVIVSRSPVLRTMLESTAPGLQEVVLPLPDPAITHDSLTLTIASLYSPVTQHLGAENAKAVLAAASFLGLHDLATVAADICEKEIGRTRHPQEFEKWFSFLKGAREEFGAGLRASIFGEEEAASNGGGHHHQKTDSNSSDGSSPGPFPSFGDSRPRSYGAHGRRLCESLLKRILALPTEYGLVDGGNDAARGHERMVQLLSVLPFSVLKDTLESVNLKIPGEDVARFKLAKAVLAERKRRAGSAEIEETVVLAFSGAGKGKSPLTLLQKSRRPNLWKVGS